MNVPLVELLKFASAAPAGRAGLAKASWLTPSTSASASPVPSSEVAVAVAANSIVPRVDHRRRGGLCGNDELVDAAPDEAGEADDGGSFDRVAGQRRWPTR